MNFDEIAMCAGEPGERIQRLHHARAPRPTAPYSAGKRYHGDTSIAERRESGVHVSIARAAPDVILLHIANIGARGKPVLRQPDSPVAQVGAYLLVLHTIEAEVLECLREGSRLCYVAIGVAAKQYIEHGLYGARHFRRGPARSAEI